MLLSLSHCSFYCQCALLFVCVLRLIDLFLVLLVCISIVNSTIFQRITLSEHFALEHDAHIVLMVSHFGLNFSLQFINPQLSSCCHMS